MASGKGNNLEFDESGYPVPDFLPTRTNLNSIFAEVEQNLPTIDFGESDDSSEGEVSIFQRALGTPTLDDADKDYDESFSNETWAKLLQPTTDLSLEPDNDLAAISQQRNDSVTSLSQIDLQTRPGYSMQLNKSVDKSVLDKGAAANIPYSPELNVNALINFGTHDDGYQYQEDDIDNRNSIPEQIKSAVENNKPPIRNVIKSNQQQQKNRSREESHTELVSQYLPSAPVLSMKSLDQYYLANVLKDIHNRNSNNPQSESVMYDAQRPALEAQSEEASLIERLTKFTMKHTDAELHNIDPKTGAVKKPTTQISKHIKTVKNVAAAEGKQMRKATTLSRGRDSSDLLNDSTSMGTNTSDLNAFAMSPPVGSNTKLPKHNASRDTVYLDLRNFDKNKQEEQHAENVQVVQRVLKIDQDDEDYSSSDSDDSNEQGLWHEQRRRMKQAAEKKIELL